MYVFIPSGALFLKTYLKMKTELLNDFLSIWPKAEVVFQPCINMAEKQALLRIREPLLNASRIQSDWSIKTVCICVCWLQFWKRIGNGYMRVIKWSVNKNRFFSNPEYFLLKMWCLSFLKKKTTVNIMKSSTMSYNLTLVLDTYNLCNIFREGRLVKHFQRQMIPLWFLNKM